MTFECLSQIPHVNFQRWVNSLSNFASFFITMTHNSSANFKLIHFLLWIKASHQSPNFWDFQVFWLKFAIFLMSFSKAQVSFSSNFASFFSVMKDHSSVLFYVKRYILFTKGTNQSGNFENFECSSQNLKNSCHFWNSKSVFLQILHHSSVSWDITLLCFFSWNFIYFQQKELIKVRTWWNFMSAVESWNFALWCSPFVQIM